MTMTKRFAAVLALILALSMLPLAACSSQSDQSNQSATGGQSSTNGVINVEVSIDASFVRDAGKDVSAFDIFTTPLSIELNEGATAYDALVAMGVQIGGTPSYVTSIEGLEAGAAGDNSGWLYEVNAVSPMVPANEYVLQNGDTIRWVYGILE